MKISVIIAAYNIENYIIKCLESIISQTFKELEIIVVNDGSTDNTLHLIKNFSKLDDRIVVIDKPNGGLSSARNAGLEIATGDYIGFVDGDDYIKEEMYEKLHQLCKKTQSEIAVCGYIRQYSNREVFSNSKNVIQYSSQEALRELISSRVLHDYAWNKLYKKELFENIRYPIGKMYEDVFTTYKLFFNSNKVAYIDEPLYYYIQRDGSILRKGFSEKQFDQLEALEELKSFLTEKKITIYDEELESRIVNVKCRMLFDITAGNAINKSSLHHTTAKALAKSIFKRSFHHLLNHKISLLSKSIILLTLPGYWLVRITMGLHPVKTLIERRVGLK
ncbi:glycosyltransferase [Neobacillus cucumis]|uniref:Glycosyl transferase n=1 Tax=Neobacillus cucumis TaxID=1740721 RepID=A0A2N5H6G8_9BACI|nr:glycosyltransferase [Neobacillus cucumis]PLS01120.1 glycosyl transferase [Neobacillus cucumis]